MSKEVYRRLSKAERKLENTNRLRTNNSTLRIKYEGVKKLLEKKDKEIERLNNIIKRLEEFIEYLEKRYKDITGVIGSYGSNTDMLYGKKDMIKEILKKCKEIEQGSDKE